MIGTKAVQDLFQTNARQVMRITLDENTIITEADIRQGGFTVDNYSMSTDTIEIGSAVSAELTLTLQNFDGRFTGILFEGVEMFVEIGVKDWSTQDPVSWIPLGYFTPVERPAKKSILTVKALDRMMWFDREIDWSLFEFPCTLEDFADVVFDACGITCATDISALPNADYVIDFAPEGLVDSYRTLVMWIAFMTATCAQIDENGHLRFKWYTPVNFEVTAADRYSHEISEQDITLTGLHYQDAGGLDYLAGETGYIIDYYGCEILQNNVEEALDNIWDALEGFSYRPFEAVVKSAPFLQPLDMITFEDTEGFVHDCIVSHVTFTGNLSTPIAGYGSTQQTASYVPPSGMTVQQREATDDARKEATNYLSKDATGIMVADSADGKQTPSTATGRNVFIDNDSVDIRDGQNVLASFGESTAIGEQGSEQIILSDHSFRMLDSARYSILYLRSLNIQEHGYAYLSTIYRNPNGTTTRYAVNYGVSEIRDAYYEDNGEKLPLPTIDPTDNAYIVFAQPPAQGRAFIVSYSTADTVYIYTIGTRLAPSHADYTGEGSRSVAIGNANSAYGNESICIGSRNSSYANFNFAFGNHLKVAMTGDTGGRTVSQVVLGRYNEQKSATEYSFIIGNGTSQSNRKNAFAINADGGTEIGFDENAAASTVDGKLYAAIEDLGWESEVIV